MPDPLPSEVDVLVYGATAGGVSAAVAAAEEGARTLLVGENAHVGGMVSGGLGKTDIERGERLIGGLAARFFAAVGSHYGEGPAYRFEPSVAEATFRSLLASAGVMVVGNRPLDGVERDGGRIAAATFGDASVASATFIDASYEGDLLRAAGISHAIGRDGRSAYGEPLAGRVELLPNPHQFRSTFSALDASGALLPGVRPYDSLAPLGGGDGLVQSYCYRLCLTDDPANRLPIGAPDGYDPQRYALVERYLAALGRDATVRDFLGIGRTRNGKTDINSGGPVSTNLLGASQPYPTASPAERAAIAEAHRSWAHGLLHLLQTDAAVPAAIRDELAAYDLAADEFADTGGWPHQLYVREAARMIGAHVLTEHDLRSGRAAPDSIGMGGYNVDIREVQWVAAPIYRFPDVFPEVMVEGYLSAPVPPYTIPYRSLLPQPSECSNLLVPVCISASHVAFSSFRMEPQYMIAGESAGVAAAIAAADSRAVHDVPVDALQARLRRRGQILILDDIPAG
ncbi:MAG TPA: FAD-dependent oxidoreductase [Candidatus Limnocylindria bacterium]|nr:FAD-dependent oxidoreductase [Candidatus Limnocylindria bacterium]